MFVFCDAKLLFRSCTFCHSIGFLSCKSLWQLQRHFTHTINIAYLNSVIPCIAIASCNPKKPDSILVIMITPAGRIPCSPIISFPLSKNLIPGQGQVSPIPQGLYLFHMILITQHLMCCCDSNCIRLKMSLISKLFALAKDIGDYIWI